MQRRGIAEMLGGGDRRSIGMSNEIAKLVLADGKRFGELFACLWHEDPIVRMRAADAAEKITRARPEFLNPYKQEVLGLLAEADQIELRWHLASMVPRLALSRAERARAAKTLQRYLEDRSSIVKTFALQGLADLGREDAQLRETTKRIFEDSLRSGTAAMKGRARKLLKKLRD